MKRESASLVCDHSGRCSTCRPSDMPRLMEAASRSAASNEWVEFLMDLDAKSEAMNARQ